MKSVISSEEENIQIDYIESCTPPIESGEYKLSATQRLKELGDSVTATQTFVIEGPRFNLAEDDVESVYPPKDMKGSFGLSLPHVVFTRKTLPFERSSFSLKNTEENKPSLVAPWIALLLLCEDEILEVNSSTAKKAVCSCAVNISYPLSENEIADGKEECHYIDINTQLFLSIMPTPEELVYLCHTRRVNILAQCLSDKNKADLNSVLIGNRLPQSSLEGSRCRAYVISLENHIKDGKYNAEMDILRLNVLYYWDFISTKETHLMKELFEQLSVDKLTYPSAATSDTAKAILAHGYVPLEHRIRNGSKTISFYRGPLVPLKLENIKSTCDNADSLYKYDPATGMFDISYAAAWQQGRMLTLNSKAIAIKIMRQRQKNLQKLYSVKGKQKLQGKICRLSNGDNEKAGSSLLNFLNESSAHIKDIL